MRLAARPVAVDAADILAISKLHLSRRSCVAVRKLMRRARVREIAVLSCATFACLAAFLVKPLHADDPLFYCTARQITRHPLDPFGFSVNWYFATVPITEVTMNPPGAAYFLAAVGEPPPSEQFDIFEILSARR